MDYIILLQPTSPYRNRNTLRRCLNLFKKNSTIKTIKIDNNENHKNKILYFNNVSYPNGSFYLIPEIIFSQKIKKNKIKYILVFNKKNIDIDNLVVLLKLKNINSIFLTKVK